MRTENFWNLKMERLRNLDNIAFLENLIKISSKETEQKEMEQEVYSLVLYHQLITKDGDTINIEEPIITRYVMDKKHNCGTAVVINEMVRKLGEYIISRFK